MSDTDGEAIAMDPRGGSDHLDLRAIRVDLLRQAMEIYLGAAYPDGALPDAVRRRLEWPTDSDAEALLNNPPFELGSRPRPGRTPVFALRLGNARYPHMKLQVQPWPNAVGFLLSVNTHDQVLALDPESGEAEAFRELQAENQRLKELIELAWDRAGLPTFLRYLKDYIDAHSSATQPAQ
ncbi:MAG TPA: hypothetical protein VGY53_09440 [Isosphaeraceae bacterium]|jgi:hypothetical protein|nr:hypothetical protein [Isosphaeraceae bacterium]